MEKTMGKEYGNAAQREQFLKDNCESCENKGYMKQFTPEELQGHKENLANVSIKISEVENEKRQSDAYYKGELKPLHEKQANIIQDIKSKAKYVEEVCYKFVDPEEKKTGYYNGDGNLIEERPATADELQPTLFRMMPKKTGTDDTEV